MSELRLITATDNDDEGWVIIDWTQMPDDDIRYDTDDKEEVMKEQAWLEAERIVWDAEEQRAREEEERCRAEEEKEAKCKHKAEAGKSSEARASGNENGEVRKVVMDPSNKKHVTCVQCNLSKGKCCWPRDGKDAKASPKARKADKGKKRKAEEENAKARPSNQKQVRTSVRLTKVLDLDELEAGGSRMKEASMARYSGLENKLDLFKLHETVVENSGCIADALKSLLNESYGYGMAVSPLDSGSSELDSDELHKEAEWLRTPGKDNEEETKGEDEAMAKGK
ncbi:hypothetical protein M404DRAFT_26541 [Pisolithus tinctorius Marx 270]|uniref:Uncharacterized protein n=1 Tax=Pisolithus tinctorius Marx 270 TaxID=870435 RepID=A0A0C3NSS6_PISTI|nr:hypothetical protein M404DRAFT_26541 [Pisolithus tinctorius Marx 270]